MGSSDNLKSRSNPRDCNELKKIECDDFKAKSSNSTKMRRSVGFSIENEFVTVNVIMSEIKIKIGDFAIRVVEIWIWSLCSE